MAGRQGPRRDTMSVVNEDELRELERDAYTAVTRAFMAAAVMDPVRAKRPGRCPMLQGRAVVAGKLCQRPSQHRGAVALAAALQEKDVVATNLRQIFKVTNEMHLVRLQLLVVVGPPGWGLWRAAALVLRTPPPALLFLQEVIQAVREELQAVK